MNQSEADLSGSSGPEERHLEQKRLARMNAKSHTPTPWVVTDSDFIRPGPMAPAVCQCNSHYAEVRENTEFIVRACNCHEELLEALEIIKDADLAHPFIPPFYREIIEEAIAKAKEKA